jgi:hypothetical protein
MLKFVGDHWLAEQNALAPVEERRRAPLLVSQTGHELFLTDIRAHRFLPYGILTHMIFTAVEKNLYARRKPVHHDLDP